MAKNNYSEMSFWNFLLFFGFFLLFMIKFDAFLNFLDIPALQLQRRKNKMLIRYKIINEIYDNTNQINNEINTIQINNF